MEEKRQYEDVDDYIFAEQEWHPSEKQSRASVFDESVAEQIDNLQLTIAQSVTDGDTLIFNFQFSIVN